MVVGSLVYATRNIAPPCAPAVLLLNTDPQTSSVVSAPSNTTAPPLPPLPGLPSVPVAALPVKLEFTTVSDPPSIPTAPPLLPVLPAKVLPTITVSPIPCEVMAPPETSCPVSAQWLSAKWQLMTSSDPPSRKI